MKIKRLLLLAATVMGVLSSCSEDDSFTTSSSHLLIFSTDTVRMDTVFSNIPSAHRSLWVYNKSGDGLRCKSIRLERGDKSGFRVNVDGRYLSEALGYGVTDVEIRKKDSIRVFVEVTAPTNNVDEAQLNDDNLIFTLESGVEQRVNLRSYAWDAAVMSNVQVSRDSTISNMNKPIVIRGGITVDEGVTLTIAAGTTLYFHNDAGIRVYGSLKTAGTQTQNVVLRGERIDRMFDYLPYDYVPGQWAGIRFYSTSTDNVLTYTDIHSAYDGVVVESKDSSTTKLTLENVTIHNCQGYGLMTDNAEVIMFNTQITNTLKDCVLFNGGNINVNNCTFAQFYPFSANRGVALHFTSAYPLHGLRVINSLITGYAKDMMQGDPGKEEAVFNYHFENSIIRTPKVKESEESHFVNVVFEDDKDAEHGGEKHFVRIDADSLRYDFRLAEVSSAIDKANPGTARPTDRNGKMRDALPDIGAYEYVKP